MSKYESNRPDGARFGKPDATGRSSGKEVGRKAAQAKPPAGETWVWLTRELLCSDAYQALGINERRFVDFLLIEQCNHAGRENGNLKATYNQLTAFGLTGGRKNISETIKKVEATGLVKVTRVGMRHMSTYTLAFYPTADGEPATDDWRKFERSKIQKSGDRSDPR